MDEVKVTKTEEKQQNQMQNQMQDQLQNRNQDLQNIGGQNQELQGGVNEEEIQRQNIQDAENLLIEDGGQEQNKKREVHPGQQGEGIGPQEGEIREVRRAFLYGDLQERPVNAAGNANENLQPQEQSLPLTSLRTRIAAKTDPLLSGENKNQALLDLCYQMHRLTGLGETKYAKAGFAKGAIACDYLDRHADKKFLTFLEKERIRHLTALGALYQKHLSTPVPERYLANKNDDPRSPELIRQFAVYQVKQSDAYREFRCIKQMTEALENKMSDRFAARIGSDGAGTFLIKQREELTKGFSEADKAFLSENETFLTHIEEEQFSGLSASALQQDNAKALTSAKRELGSYLSDRNVERDLELPEDMIVQEVSDRKLKKDETYPPLKEGEVFHASHQYRNAELTCRMARLLSMDSLVREACKAKKMDKKKDVETEGVIVKRYQKEGFQKAHDTDGKELTDTAKEQIAELTFLNLICGNNINLKANMIVERETGEGRIDAVRLAKGTENAFGQINGTFLEDLFREAQFSLQILGNQPGNIRERILNLSPQLVKELFKDDLQEIPLDRLLSRLTAVQDMLRQFEKMKEKERSFAAKKVRKYQRQVQVNSTETRLESLPGEFGDVAGQLVTYERHFKGKVSDALSSIPDAEFFPQEKTRLQEAIKGQEELFRSVLMEQVDRFLALGLSQDFEEKIRNHDPGALAVQKEYKESVKSALKRYRAKIDAMTRSLQEVTTKEDLMAFAYSQEVLNNREAFFAEVQKSRYKNNEDSDSMYLVKESVRVLSDRGTDPNITGPEALKKKLKMLDMHYRVALENCQMYIKSHKPLIGFWHEDGRKRYEMVQELEKRLLREKKQIESNGALILNRMMTSEKQTTNLAELLAYRELRDVKLAYIRMKADAQKEDETGNVGQLAKHAEACEKENLIDQKAVKGAISKIRGIDKPEFFAGLHLASPEEVLRNKTENDAFFAEMEKAYGVFRDYMLLTGDLQEKDCGSLEEKDKAAFWTGYRFLKEVKDAAEEYYRAAKELALHPLRFTAEAQGYAALTLEELTEKEREQAPGEKKTYFALLIAQRKSEKFLSGLGTVGTFTACFETTAQKIREENAQKKVDPAVGLLKDLVKDAPDPEQEKNRVIYHLKDVFKEAATKVKGKPPEYLVAHLWGKSNDEIRAFVRRMYAGTPEEKHQALKEIVERSAKEATVLLHGANKSPVRMMVNAEYYYGLALRAAALSNAYKALQDYEKEQKEKNPQVVLPELSKESKEEVLVRIEIAKELGLSRYEERYRMNKQHLLQEEQMRDVKRYTDEVNGKEANRNELGLLPLMDAHHLITLVEKKYSDASPKVMLRLYHQMLMQAQRCGATQFAGSDLKLYNDLTEEQLEAELRKYEERKRLVENLPAAQKVYYAKYKEGRKSPEYRKEEFRAKWNAFQNLNIADLKMNSIPEMIANIGQNTALFQQAAEMKQLLSLAIINGEEFTDQELMDAEIKCKVFRQADMYTSRIFDLIRRDSFLYVDTDRFLGMEEDKIKLLRGELNKKEEDSFTAFFDDGVIKLSALGIRLGEGGIADCEKAIRKRALEHRKEKEKKIGDLYRLMYGKEISEEELEKRVKDYEKNRALWSGMAELKRDLTDRQIPYNRLIDENNKQHGTRLSGTNPREFGAYIPNLPEEKQIELIQKWGQGDEGMLSIYSDMIDEILNMDLSLLEGTSTKEMAGNFHKISPMLTMIGEMGAVWQGFKECLTRLAKKMKEDKKSDEEIKAFIREKMPSDEKVKRFFAIREEGMIIQYRWQALRDSMLASTDKYDMESLFGLVTIEDLDGMDHVRITKDITDGALELAPEIDMLISNGANGFAKQMNFDYVEVDGKEEVVYSVKVDLVDKSKNLRSNIERGMENVKVDELKKIQY